MSETNKKINNFNTKILKKLINDIKQIDNEEDYQIIGNIIWDDIKNGKSDKKSIIETTKGTWFILNLMSDKVIKLLQYYLLIKEQNDKIDDMKKNLQ